MSPEGQAAREQAVGHTLSFVERFNDVILTPVILFLLSVALIVFLYGLFEFLMNANNEQGREAGKKHLLWGLIGLVVMTSALTILQIATATFGVDSDLGEFMGTL